MRRALGPGDSTGPCLLSHQHVGIQTHTTLLKRGDTREQPGRWEAEAEDKDGTRNRPASISAGPPTQGGSGVPAKRGVCIGRGMCKRPGAGGECGYSEGRGKGAIPGNGKNIQETKRAGYRGRWRSVTVTDDNVGGKWGVRAAARLYISNQQVREELGPSEQWRASRPVLRGRT